MVPLRSALVIDAAPAAVEGALWSASAWSRAWSGRGFAVEIADPGRPAAGADPGRPAAGDDPGRPGGGARPEPADARPEPADARREPADDRLRPGTVVRLTARPRGTAGMFRVASPGPDVIAGDGGVRDPKAGAADGQGAASPTGPTMAGIAGAARGWTVRTGLAVTGAGCLVTIDARHPGRVRRPGVRRRVLRFEELLLGLVALIAREAERPPVVVVAGVIIEDGRVLAARRRYPPELAGCWECPGGKVEPGETERAALARELSEELGVDTEVGGRIGADIPIGAGMVLHAYRARITGGRPVARDHDEIAWVGSAGLRSVAWLPSDAPLIEDLAVLLAGPESSNG